MVLPSKSLNTSITAKIGQFVSETAAKDLPEDALEQARRAIMDYIGVSLAGSREELGRMVVDYAKSMGGVGKSTIIGSGLQTSPSLAALANGTMGHAMDYDDYAMAIGGHPSVALAPAIFAIGETVGASGKDVMAAYVVGYEAACCIAGPLAQSHYTRGWHNTATFGGLGAAAAAAWLVKLSAWEVRMALGIAASTVGGLRQNFGTMTKPLHAGNAAAHGVVAVLLAQRGFTSSENIVEAPMGFAKVFGHDEEVDWGKASKDLGKSFAITAVTGGLIFKPYPCCGGNHCGIDAARYIKQEFKVEPQEIAEVELGVSPFVRQVLIHHHPRTSLEGKFSLEYNVARALISGTVRLEHMSDNAVNDPQIQSLMAKMKWVNKYPMPVWAEGSGPTTVTVRLRDGREFSKEVAFAKGTPQNPLNPEEFQSKYRDCASIVLSKEDTEKSSSLLADLEKVKDIKEITEIVGRRTSD